MNNEPQKLGLLAKILAIIGFSAIVLLIVWGIIAFVTNAPAIFSNLASIVREKEEQVALVDDFDDFIDGLNNDDTQQDETPVPPEEVIEDETVVEVENTVVVTPPVVNPAPAPSIPTQPRYTYPVSNPNGYIDLKITIHGIAIVSNGVFSYVQRYTPGRYHVVIVEIENLGTKTSEAWSFSTYIGNRELYTSPLQVPLKPKEHAVLTVPFSSHEIGGNTVLSSVFTRNDVDTRNNTSSHTFHLQ